MNCLRALGGLVWLGIPLVIGCGRGAEPRETSTADELSQFLEVNPDMANLEEINARMLREEQELRKQPE